MGRWVYAKHPPYPDAVRLNVVSDEMMWAGAPTIRCSMFNNELFALEGSHRLYLAHRTGLAPKIVVEPNDGILPHDYWYRVKNSLPKYWFPLVHVLRLDIAVFK